MKCKYCEAELAQWGGFCPVCGKNNTTEEEIEMTQEEEEVLAEETEVTEEEIETTEEEIEEESEECEEESETTAKLKKAKRMAGMSACIALLAVLATVLFFGIRGGWDADKLINSLKPRQNNIHFKDSYSVSDKKAERKSDVVVATMGDHELTNAQLQIYYWNEVYGFLSNYSYYLSYIGFDYTKPLDEQACYFDNTMTWQQYFLDSAIQIWQSNVAFAELAKKNNFVLPEEPRAELDKMESELQAAADKGGYASLDAMVQESFGAGVTFADYKEYMEVYYLGYAYFEELYNAIDPTVEELDAYYEANRDALIKDGIQKDGTYTVDVRHILVKIDKVTVDTGDAEGGADNEESGTDAQDEEDDDGYSEAQWNACFERAWEIYNMFLAGDLTEERFGELANEHSHDNNGNVTNGGLYTFVEEGKMVEDFNGWCFEEGRKPGDTGVVKTKFGYHVMYFVGSEETWITGTRSAYISAESDKIVENALSQFTIQINYKKIAVSDVKLA